MYAKLSFGRKLKIKVNHFFYSLRHTKLSTIVILSLLDRKSVV